MGRYHTERAPQKPVNTQMQLNFKRTSPLYHLKGVVAAKEVSGDLSNPGLFNDILKALAPIAGANKLRGNVRS